MADKGLGKGPGAGLGALFGSEALYEEEETVINLPISKVEPRSDQPRFMFNEEALQELSESLKQYGLIQPITVRKLSTGYYQIIAGERRWRAARMAGLTEVPVRVMEADDRRAMELALVENLQREDLNPIEEARGYKALMEDYGLTQEQAAQSVGKSRPTITNALRLLMLDQQVMDYVENGELSAGHARALLAIHDSTIQQMTADRVIHQGMSVRQTEALASRTVKNLIAEQNPMPPAPVDYVGEVERQLSASMGRKVKISHKGDRGRIQLDYYGSDDMETLIQGLASLSRYAQND